MLIAVVALPLVSFVVRFMFLITMLPGMLTGIVALHYHLNLALSIVIIFIEVLVPIILFAVVARALVLTVGLSMFMLTMPSLLLTGFLAPPYHLNLVYRVIIFIKVELLQDILIAVVTLTLVPPVGLSLLLLHMLLLILTGLMAPHYHLNQLTNKKRKGLTINQSFASSNGSIGL